MHPKYGTRGLNALIPISLLICQLVDDCIKFFLLVSTCSSFSESWLLYGSTFVLKYQSLLTLPSLCPAPPPPPTTSSILAFRSYEIVGRSSTKIAPEAFQDS